MTLKNKRLYATLLVNLILSSKALSSEEMKIVNDVKVNIPGVVDIKDREILREFLYLNTDLLSSDTQRAMNNVLNAWESNAVRPTNSVTFDEKSIVTKPVSRLQVDADY